MLFTGVDVLFPSALFALHLAAPHELAPEQGKHSPVSFWFLFVRKTADR